MRIYHLLFLALFAFSSCEKAFLGPDAENTPESNFELFWEDFDRNYGLFTARGWNWDSMYTAYRHRVSPQTSRTELWSMFKEMTAYLDDSHTFLYDPEVGEFFASGSEMDSIVELEFSLNLLQASYLENITQHGDPTDDDVYMHAKVRGRDIGYIYLDGIDADNPKEMIESMVEGIEDYAALVLDLRNNGGGDDLTAATFASRFADGEHLIYTVEERNGPEHDDFSNPIQYFSTMDGDQRYTKPLVVLTDRITVSAAEVFLLHLKSFDQVSQIGDSTAGDFSDIGMRRFLPNGMQYPYSIMRFRDANGQVLDGIGHVPNIQIRNTPADIEANIDVVMDRALQFLFDEYGIQ
ncbi:MAG: S41 family peptidase [Bacteroidota bacterium]